MNKIVNRKYTGSRVALVAAEQNTVFVHQGPCVALDADEATEYANAILDAAGEARGWELAQLLPGSKEPEVRAA